MFLFLRKNSQLPHGTWPKTNPTSVPHYHHIDVKRRCSWLPNKAPAVASSIWMVIFLSGKTWEWPLLSSWFRMKPLWSDLAIEIGLGSGTNSHSCNVWYCAQGELSHWPLCPMLHWRAFFIVSHAHCFPVSFIANEYVERTEVTYIVKVQIIQQDS